jgi:hypothetical protein
MMSYYNEYIERVVNALSLEDPLLDLKSSSKKLALKVVQQFTKDFPQYEKRSFTIEQTIALTIKINAVQLIATISSQTKNKNNEDKLIITKQKIHDFLLEHLFEQYTLDLIKQAIEGWKDTTGEKNLNKGLKDAAHFCYNVFNSLALPYEIELREYEYRLKYAKSILDEIASDAALLNIFNGGYYQYLQHMLSNSSYWTDGKGKKLLDRLQILLTATKKAEFTECIQIAADQLKLGANFSDKIRAIIKPDQSVSNSNSSSNSNSNSNKKMKAYRR